jgi:hypothetical protein
MEIRCWIKMEKGGLRKKRKRFDKGKGGRSWGCI